MIAKTISKEGDPEQLLTARATTYFNYLVIAVSTPTQDGSSRISRRFEQSSKGYFHAKCPHCFNLEKPLWENVYYDEKNPTDCGYTCSHCQVMWTESDRAKATRDGEYIHERPEETEHLGFHANCIVSPFQPLSHFVKIYIEAKKESESLRSFTNVYLAETYKPQVDVPDFERLYERRESYPTDTVPTSEIKFLTMGVDVQGDRLEAHVVGWTKDKQSYSIAYRVLTGPTHTEEPWLQLKNLIQSSFPIADTGLSMPISLTCVDSGFNTSHVHSFVSKFSPNKVRAIKGSDHLQTFFKMGSDLQFHNDGSSNKFAQKTWVIGSSYLKEYFYSLLKLPVFSDDGTVPAGFCHFPEYDLDFFKGICSESLVLEKGKYVWQKHFRRNEPLDTFLYARAAASMFGLDRFTDQEWQQIDNYLQQQQLPKIQPMKPIQQKQPVSNPLWRNPNLQRRR